MGQERRRVNIHEEYHRTRKVTAMADVIWRHLSERERTDRRLAGRIWTKGQAWRDAIAREAKVNTPSVVTWAALCDRVSELVEAQIAHKIATTPAPLFVSVDRPELGLVKANEIDLCDECGRMSGAEYEDAMGRFGHECLTCRGYRLVHGYTTSGRGYPVVPLQRGGGMTSAPHGSDDHTSANNRRPLPPSHQVA